MDKETKAMTAKPPDGTLSDERIDTCQTQLQLRGSRNDAYRDDLLTAICTQAKAFNALNAKLAAAGEMPEEPRAIEFEHAKNCSDPSRYCDCDLDHRYELAKAEYLAALRATCTALRARCAEMLPDAERYRHLRTQHEINDEQLTHNNYGKSYPPRTMCVFQDDGEDGLEAIKCDPGALDEAIDSARSGGKDDR